MLELDNPTFTRWPAVPSKTMTPIVFTVLIVIGILGPLIVTRPVALTGSARRVNGTKKSWVLMAVPLGVVTVMWPDPVCVGTAVTIVLVFADVTAARRVLKNTRLLGELGSKFVPVMVTGVPATPMVGVKLVIVGAPPVPV